MNLVCPSIIFGEKLAAKLPVSNHVYAYRLMQPMENLNLGLKTFKWMGITHAQDLFYLFMPQVIKNVREARLLGHRMLEDWTAFAKSGRPENALWKESYNREANDFNTTYIHLENGNMKLVSGHFKDTCGKLWKPIIFA